MSDQHIAPVSTDSPEYIAFVLMKERVAAEERAPADPDAMNTAMKKAMRKWILDSYAECMLSRAEDKRR